MWLVFWSAIILLILLASPRSALIWTLIFGALLETVSPYPVFVYFAALIMAFFILRIFVRNVISHRTLWGAALTATFGSALLHALLFVFAWLGQQISAGWAPALQLAYFSYLIQNTLTVVLLVTFVFFIAQRFSPKVRGVLIEPH